jgi:preprotein translocase subunit SecG
MQTILSVLFILVCVLLIGVILLQKGRGGGLSGAFGGAGGHSAFGTRTGDMFTWVTVVLVGLFIILAVLCVQVFRPAGMTNTRQARAAAPAELPAGEAATQPTTATAPADEMPAQTAPAAENTK